MNRQIYFPDISSNIKNILLNTRQDRLVYSKRLIFLEKCLKIDLNDFFCNHILSAKRRMKKVQKYSILSCHIKTLYLKLTSKLPLLCNLNVEISITFYHF